MKDFRWILQYIVVPIAISIYYIINTKKHERSYNMVKSVWYFYYAFFNCLFKFAISSVSNDDLIGFTVALALYEGTPGLVQLYKWKWKKILHKDR